MHESSHHLFEFLLAHLPMRYTHTRLRTNLLHEVRKRIDGFDTIVDHIDLTASIEFKIDRVLYDNGLEFHDDGLNCETIARGRLNHRHIPQSTQRHIQDAR